MWFSSLKTKFLTNVQSERFVQALRWYAGNGFISGFDQTWGYAHKPSATDTGIVCDWSGIDSSSSVTDMPECSKAICPGHKEDDTLPFTVSIASRSLCASDAELFD